MSEWPSAGPRADLRARRWDAILLGGALPGLIAAARLAMAGHRVLVVEEEHAVRTPVPLREPFLLAGAASGGVLDQCLRALAIPLIDLRRLECDPVAYQVVMPEARLDVGGPARTAEELAAWGFAKSEGAATLLRALAQAATAEREAMLAAPVVRTGGLRRLGRGSRTPPRHPRGLPAEAANAPLELSAFFEAQIRALSNLGEATPPPEARARLLGTGLEGGVDFPTTEFTLRGLLRRRIQGLHGEFRSLAGGFALTAVGNQPGLAPTRSQELWVGRALVLNAHRALLAASLRDAQAEIPPALQVSAPTRRRVAVHLRADPLVVPEGMARRVIWVRDPARPLEGTNAVCLGVHPPARPGQAADLVASAIVNRGDDIEAWESEIESAVHGLMPFSEGRLRRARHPRPSWDDDAVLADPASGAGWPAEAEIRVTSRPPVYELPRPALAALGVEGDVLLGWRAGDRIAADLA